MIPAEKHLQIGSMLFEGLDQIDLTGPFEVLSRIPNSTYRVIGKTRATVKDIRGLLLTPEATYDEIPLLDVLCAGRSRSAGPDEGRGHVVLHPQAGGTCH